MPSSPVQAAALMTAGEVSEILNVVPVSTIHAWARAGYLPSLKLGKHRRFHRDDVAAFLDAQRRGVA